MSVRITCISKAGGDHENSHVAISELGWINEGTGETGKSTRLEIYDWIALLAIAVQSLRCARRLIFNPLSTLGPYASAGRISRKNGRRVSSSSSTTHVPRRQSNMA